MARVWCNPGSIALKSTISASVSDATSPPREGSTGTRRFDVDPASLASALEWFAPLARYHRLEVEGIEQIPRGAALFVANHSGGLNPVDALFLFRYYEQRGVDDPIFVLGHDLLFGMPRFAEVLHSIGALRASREEAEAVLQAGHKLLVFPGGDLDNMRAFRQRREVVFGGRCGFVKLARAGNAPIIPVVSAGTHETFVVLSQGRRLAKMMGLPRRLRVNSCPIALAAPWGVVWGPGILLPYLPLPSKVTVRVGRPMSLRDGCFDGLDERGVAEHIRGTMQETLEALYAQRRFPVLG